jgi:hypothetical protein
VSADGLLRAAAGGSPEARPLLSIVIPALDEEAAIGGTLERCLAARGHVEAAGGVRGVEILVVSDGSTDRTEAIARGFPEVTVLAFDRNRGYGAAIKCGFEHARGELLGFLDADGTCDPAVFADLCRALEASRADVVLGSRMGPGTEMPRIRAIGNAVFAWMLGLLSQRRISDTASGMRVLRRDALPRLLPLPDGLHFTPAMSARVLLEGVLRLVEVPMPYAERTGRSKLSVLRDGVRFFRAIVQAAMCFRPARPLLLLASLVALAGAALGLGPSLFWIRHARLEEWMIYRLLLASLLATGVALLVLTAVVAERIAATVHGRPAAATGVTGLAARVLTQRVRRVGGLVLLVAAVVLVWPGLAEYATTGHVTMHWSRALLASLFVVIAATVGTASFLLGMLALIADARRPGSAVLPPDRVRPGQPEPVA